MHQDPPDTSSCTLRCLFFQASLGLYLAAFSTGLHAADSAAGPDHPAWPLHTHGRYIVDSHDHRFKLASINWYGASDTEMVPGGLDTASLPDIVKAIKSSGFNSIRLPFSNHMLHVTTSVEPRSVAANPALVGHTPLEVLDAVVQELTTQGLAVILNNHTTHPMWCCSYDDDGLWYTKDYSESQWLDDWAMMAARYQNNPGVVGTDLRNEIRVTKLGGTYLPNIPHWGQGPNDWRAAAETAGNRILAINPNLLIIVEGLNFPRDQLRFAHTDPVRLKVADRLVYSAHNYAYTSPEPVGKPYGAMDYESFRQRMTLEWGFAVTPSQAYTAPVWLSEFGVGGVSDEMGHTWLEHISRYLQDTDIDFAYWAVNAGAKPSGEMEPFAWLDLDWQTPLDDWRKDVLQPLFTPQHGPGVDPDWQQDPANHFEALIFSDWDSDHSQSRDDWHKGSFKATCRDDARLVGISAGERGAQPFGHLVLCTDYVTSGAATKRVTLDNDNHDVGAAGLSGIQDWSPGSNKLTCPPNNYLIGVAQQRKALTYRITGVRCAESPVPLGSDCHALYFGKGDARATDIPGDWDPGQRKGQCGLNEYAAGLSLKSGVVQSILCCYLGAR